MISINGSSKTGTHLLQKVVMMYQFDAVHQHQPFPAQINGKHIHIIRNPRNVLISWVRFIGKKVRDRTLIPEMDLMIAEMDSYVGWLNDPDCLTVRFEDLLTDPNELERISTFLDLPTPENAFRGMWGQTNTFTGKLSNWKKHWSDKIEKQWVNKGGITLENKLGYSKNDPIKIRPKP